MRKFPIFEYKGVFYPTPDTVIQGLFYEKICDLHPPFSESHPVKRLQFLFFQFEQLELYSEIKL